jgi:DNA-binding MarR family transcriptional regulator
MESVGLITKERFADDQRRDLVSLTRQSVTLVRAISTEVEALYMELERTVGLEVVDRVYRAQSTICWLGSSDRRALTGRHTLTAVTPAMIIAVHDCAVIC